MCNGCGKLDNELFLHMVPVLRCPACSTPYELGQVSCLACGTTLPDLPQINQTQDSCKNENQTQLANRAAQSS
jgi:hypothetical protein